MKLLKNKVVQKIQQQHEVFNTRKNIVYEESCGTTKNKNKTQIKARMK